MGRTYVHRVSSASYVSLSLSLILDAKYAHLPSCYFASVYVDVHPHSVRTLSYPHIGSLLQVRLQLWDIAGQERFSSMTRVYYKQATACVIIFDITRRSTFQEVLKWKADLDNKTRLPSGDLLPCLLVANKCDLPARPVPTEEIQAMCDEQGFVVRMDTDPIFLFWCPRCGNWLVDRRGDAQSPPASAFESVSLEVALFPNHLRGWGTPPASTFGSVS